MDAQDHFFDRLVLKGFGSYEEVTQKWSLVRCIKAHQQLDLMAQSERIMYEMNKPKK